MKLISFEYKESGFGWLLGSGNSYFFFGEENGEIFEMRKRWVGMKNGGMKSYWVKVEEGIPKKP